jgi:hypothetical protein
MAGAAKTGHVVDTPGRLGCDAKPRKQCTYQVEAWSLIPPKWIPWAGESVVQPAIWVAHKEETGVRVDLLLFADSSGARSGAEFAPEKYGDKRR